MPRVLGTKVKNPVRRQGADYSECYMCQRLYTSIGISRHWGKCPKRSAMEAINGNK